MYKLGEVYYMGSKVKGDRELAKSWLQKSKDKGNKDAAALLSKIEQHQIKLTDNDPEALYTEGIDILDEVLKGKLPKEGIHLLEESANAGYQPAVARLGYEYERGRHVKKDITKAKEYFLEASKSNNTQALSGLGSMYLNGDGVPQNREIAFDYFKKASELGSICDKENVALCFFMGYGVKQDFKRALIEYLNVINYDSLGVTNTEARSRSLTNIGYIYSFILKDRIEGNRWFSKAISIENPYDEAYYYLGMAFWLGEGVDQNKEKGIELLKTGRSKGNAKCVEALKSFNLN
jgi:TPR repeat protein